MRIPIVMLNHCKAQQVNGMSNTIRPSPNVDRHNRMKLESEKKKENRNRNKNRNKALIKPMNQIFINSIAWVVIIDCCVWCIQCVVYWKWNKLSHLEGVFFSILVLIVFYSVLSKIKRVSVRFESFDQQLVPSEEIKKNINFETFCL